MTQGLPDPLVPAEVDLSDFVFMPLEVGRLRRSKAWLQCKRRPELAFYMLNLWSAAWHERPAGSLEDDDDVLADLAMCKPERWAKIRAAALHGWVKCSDGRLYHPTVAEKALEAWQSRVDYRNRTAAARAAKLLKAQQGGGLSQGQSQPLSEAPTDQRQRGHRPVTALKGQGQGQGEGQGQGDSKNLRPSPPAERDAGTLNGNGTEHEPRPRRGRRAEGTSPRDLGTNPRANGTNPRAIRDRGIQAFTRGCHLIAKVNGTTDLTWKYVAEQTADDPAIEIAIAAAGGHRAIADADRFTRPQIEERFRAAYEQAVMEAESKQ